VLPSTPEVGDGVHSDAILCSDATVSHALLSQLGQVMDIEGCVWRGRLSFGAGHVCHLSEKLQVLQENY